MSYIAIILLLGAAVCIHGRKLPHLSWAKEVGDDLCQGKLFSCANCTYTRICRPTENGALVNYIDNECPKDRSWCDPDSGTCVEKEPPICGQKDDSFICLQKNRYFPATDCHQFHYCDDKYEAKLFSCKQNKVFNPLTVDCDDKTECGNYPCFKTAQKVTHQHFVKYYAMCDQQKGNDAYDPVVINVCPEYFTLNVTSQVCEPDCENHFNFNIPDPTDCHNYYHCFEQFVTETEYIRYATKLQCPPSQAYDPSAYICVDEKTVDSCNI